MEIRINAYLVHGLGNIEHLLIKVTEQKRLIIEEKLKEQKLKIVNILKKLQKEEVIKSIRIPRNKKIQKELDELVLAKQKIIKGLDQIKITFN